MRVEITKQTACKGEKYYPGDIIEVDKVDGRVLCQTLHAKEVDKDTRKAKSPMRAAIVAARKGGGDDNPEAAGGGGGD